MGFAYFDHQNITQRVVNFCFRWEWNIDFGGKITTCSGGRIAHIFRMQFCTITLLHLNINYSFTLYFYHSKQFIQKQCVTQCNKLVLYYYSLPIKKASNKGGLNKYSDHSNLLELIFASASPHRQIPVSLWSNRHVRLH